MNNSQIISNVIVPLITNATGIRISPIHEESLEKYVEKAAQEKSMSFNDYCKLLIPNTKEFENLINAATTNETYFFREKIQFEFLQNKVFPFYRGKELTIWCGACSSGEEPISLLALSKLCGVKAKIFASDIDSNELDFFKKGFYSKYSFNQDGKEYHEILEKVKCGKFEGEKFYLSKEVFNDITVEQFNLAGKVLPSFFETADIIFLRNVFIYFDNNLRKQVLELAAKKLAPGGLLFLSVSEICCIGADLIPESLEKVNCGSVFYLVKKGGSKTYLFNATFTKESQKNDLEIDEKVNLVIQKNADKIKNQKTESVEQVFEKINEFLSLKKFDNAIEYLNGYTPSFGEKFYKEYFYALISKEKSDLDDAIRHFVLAETMNPSFWPAFFNHAMIIKQQGKEDFAKHCFEKCLNALEEYISSKKEDYNFLMESFNPSYFYELCKKNVCNDLK